MNFESVDAHCHLNFFEDAGDIALRCENTKTHTIYVTTLPSQFEETFKYVKQLKYIYPSLGFHCLESKYNLDKEKEIFSKNLDLTKYIGEIGLDFSKKSITSKDEQIELFEFILNIISKKDKILSLHSTNAEDKVLELLVNYKIEKAIFHWYCGKITTLKTILNYGYYFSINESMCKSKKGQVIISKIPKNRILVETDAPFIKNVLPYNNNFVYDYLSEYWDIPIIDVYKIIYKNFNILCNNKVITQQTLL